MQTVRRKRTQQGWLQGYRSSASGQEQSGQTRPLLEAFTHNQDDLSRVAIVAMYEGGMHLIRAVDASLVTDPVHDIRSRVRRSTPVTREGVVDPCGAIVSTPGEGAVAPRPTFKP